VRLVFFLASAITAGAVGVTQGVIPLPTQIMQAVFAPSEDPAQIRTGSANPVEAYNRTLPQILRGTSLEDLGLHGAEVTLPPVTVRSGIGPVNVGAIGQSGLASNAVSQVQQNNSRMQELVTFARNPFASHDAPSR
jgi:hypothetical protein